MHLADFNFRTEFSRWTAAEVVEDTDPSLARALRCGTPDAIAWHADCADVASRRLETDDPDVYAVLRRQTVEDLPSDDEGDVLVEVLARYVYAEIFEKIGQTGVAEAVRDGRFDLMPIGMLAAKRLHIALMTVSPIEPDDPSLCSYWLRCYDDWVFTQLVEEHNATLAASLRAGEPIALEWLRTCIESGKAAFERATGSSWFIPTEEHEARAMLSFLTAAVCESLGSVSPPIPTLLGSSYASFRHALAAAAPR